MEFVVTLAAHPENERCPLGICRRMANPGLSVKTTEWMKEGLARMYSSAMTAADSLDGRVAVAGRRPSLTRSCSRRQCARK